MKTFNVYLRDGRVVPVHAETYHVDSNQYVFVRPDDSEVHFFLMSEVSGIVEAPKFAFEAVPRAPRTPLL
jgi:hypothetical protein